MREEYNKTLSQIDPWDLVFLDEFGLHTNAQRSHARSLKGQRVYARTQQSNCKNISWIGAVSLEKGLHALCQLPGPLTGERFKAWLSGVLLPRLRRGQVIVMDNLCVHKVKGVKELIEGFGCKLLFTPPYSPWFNPSEECWSKLKTIARGRPLGSADKVFEAICFAARQVHIDDVDHWFKHAGLKVA